MQVMLKKKNFYHKIYTWFLCLYGGDKARAFKNALQSLQYSLKSLKSIYIRNGSMLKWFPDYNLQSKNSRLQNSSFQSTVNVCDLRLK